MTDPDRDSVLIDRGGGIATVTLNRPGRRNAIDRRMLEQLGDALDAAEADPTVRAVVLTGAGGAFSSGFDLQEQAACRPQGEDEWRELLEHAFSTLMRCWRLSKPTIAAVRGPCLAGGCELALACDITIAGDDAVFGEPELRFGAGIVVMILPWLVGAKRAKDIILTGQGGIGAVEALGMGLVSRVVPAAEALATAQAMAGQIAVVDPALVGATKRSLNRAFEIMGMERALAEALRGDIALENAGTPEKAAFLEIIRTAGLRAALDWRDQRFTGRVGA
jgi:enoyl-CoA hydratase